MLPLEPQKLLPSKNGEAGHDHAAPLAPSAGHRLPAEPPPAPPAALQSAPSLGALLHSFRRSWKSVVPLAIIASVVSGAAMWFMVPAQYTTWASFRILSRPNLGILDGEENFAAVQKAQMSTATSHAVVAEAVKRAKLADQFGVGISAESLQKKLKAAFNEGPEIMSLSLSSEHPEAAAALLNAISDVYPKKVLAEQEALVRGDDRREGEVPGLVEDEAGRRPRHPRRAGDEGGDHRHP